MLIFQTIVCIRSVQAAYIFSLAFAKSTVLWDPDRHDARWFSQSVALHATFAHVQMVLHRPFIRPKTKAQWNLGFPSLSICANAARSCCRVIETHLKRDELSVFLPLAPLNFVSAALLLVDIWNQGRNLGWTDSKLVLYRKDVQRCMNNLQKFEQRWFMAGKCACVRSFFVTNHTG